MGTISPSGWAHRPDDAEENELIPGPFNITEMPVRKPPPVPRDIGKLGNTVAGATKDSE